MLLPPSIGCPPGATSGEFFVSLLSGTGHSIRHVEVLHLAATGRQAVVFAARCANDIGVHSLTPLIYAYTAELPDEEAAAKSRVQRELEELIRYDPR